MIPLCRWCSLPDLHLNRGECITFLQHKLNEGGAEVQALRDALRGLLGWTFGGACSDCDMFREAPSCVDFIHEHDCAHLEDINVALALLGREPEVGHHYEDAKREMARMASLRTHYVIAGYLVKWGEALRDRYSV